jgi:mono/diheme cytochrome c family protein
MRILGLSGSRLALFYFGSALFYTPVALAQDQALIAAGQEVFMANCAICHGADLNPMPGVFDLKSLRVNQRDRFNSSVMQGVGDGMPAWEGIVTPEQLDQLWAFIQAN